jgi:acetyl coenzyme A synthetase (ADP forming)-like protein
MQSAPGAVPTPVAAATAPHVRPAYRRDVVLRDGTSIAIRSLAPDDRQAVAALFGRMSPLSLRHRFFTYKRELSAAELDSLTRTDAAHVVLAATTRRDGSEQLLGLGRYVVLEGVAPPSAEVAFEVGDADQGRGIGTLLLEHLAASARAEGIRVFRAEVEGDNDRMLGVFEDVGFPVRETCDGEVRHVEIPIAETDVFLRASADRERRAAARSIRAVFAPSSVAVIGASRAQGSVGRAILDNLIAGGFQGRIYPVNPAGGEIAGLPSHASIAAAAAAAGAPIELAVIAVPARAVEGVVAECAGSGVRAVVVISSGFAEVGPEGRAVERRLRELARGAGMRLIGPNCMGVLSTDPAVRLNATFAPAPPPAGNVSMATQSGALGLAIIDQARELELGLADFASIGNKADVSGNDLLSYWHADPRTRVIALYLESFGNPRAFARLAPEVARARPIVAVKSGRSAAGTRAASSHSAALASLDVGVDALFAQTGVIRTDTLEQMFDLLALLSSQPVPAGPRVGVVTNAGGPGILLADACEARGLALPRLADETLAALRAFLPVHAGLANPIDMTAAAPAEHFAAALELVGKDPNVDAVVAIYVPPLVTRPEDIARAIARGAGAIPADKPIAAVFMSSQGRPPELSSGPRGAIPAYRFPESVALALAAAARYGAWRRRPAGARRRLGPAAEQAVRARIEAWMAEHPDGGWVALDEIAALLELVGVHVAAHRGVPADPAAAAEAAGEVGFPVVLKAVSPALLHKTDVGGVALGLADAAAVRAAAGDMRARLAARGLALTGFVVQHQVPRGVEALVGVTSDPSLGPLLVAGIGGVAVELYKDVAFRVTPVTDVDAAEMLDQLRGRALLDGFRGAPPADRPALIEVLLAISELVELVPELCELDLNPVIVAEPGAGATAVDARLRLRPPPRERRA